MYKKRVYQICFMFGLLIFLSSGNLYNSKHGFHQTMPAQIAQSIGMAPPQLSVDLNRITPEEKEAIIQKAMNNLWLYEEDLSRNQPQPLQIQAENGQIAYIGGDSQSIWIMNPDGTANHWMVRGIANIDALTWSGDSRYLAFVGDGLFDRCLFRYDFDQRGYRSLICGYASIYSPRWSPQAGHILFIGEQTAGGGLYTWILNADGSSPTQLVPELPQSWWPDWVDEDTVTVPIENPANVYRLYTVDLNNPNNANPITPEYKCSAECTCTDTDVHLGSPQTSPDGEFISFVGARTEGSKLGGCVGYYAVYLVDPGGIDLPARKSDIADTSAGNVASVGISRWSHDNLQYAIYANSSDATMRLNIFDTTSWTLSILHNREGGAWGTFDWSPDSTLIAASNALPEQASEVGVINPPADTFTRLEEGMDPAWSTLPSEAPIDLEAIDIEVTQAIQSEDNNIPLIEGKDTWVRVYARSSPGDVEGVTARLVVMKDGQELIEQPVNQYITVRKDGSNREDLNQTFNFLLKHPAWTNGTIKIRAEVGPDQQFYELDDTNNFFPRKIVEPLSFSFVKTNNILVASYRFEFTDPNGEKHIVSTSAIEEVIQYSRWTYPVASNGLVFINQEQIIPVKTADYNFRTATSWIKLLSKIPCDTSIYTRCFGWVPKEVQPVPSPYWGWGNSPRAASTIGYGSLTAHELGHTYLGDGHPNCAMIDMFGFRGDLSKQRVYDPERYFDFMNPNTPCGMLTDFQWVSSKDYQGILEKITPKINISDQNLTNAALSYIEISGVVTPGISGEIYPLFTFTHTIGYDDGAGTGPYRIDLLNTYDQIMFSRYFDGKYSELDVNGSIYFIETLPRPNNTSKVILWEGTLKLGETSASKNVPQVQFVTPLDGLNLTGDVTIEWSASDGDGDILNYAVEFSKDGGQSWELIVVNLSDPFFTLNTENLSGTISGKIRIIASDGLNSNYATSEGYFEIEKKYPQITIISPSNNIRIVSGVGLNLVASSYDVEDGILTGESLVWKLDEGQIVGTGGLASISEIGYGPHIITLTATDSDGMSSIATIMINVTDLPYQTFIPVVSTAGQ